LTDKGVRVVFMGTSDFAVPTLRALVRTGYDVAGVVCQPDKPVGRGLRVAASPIKQTALALGLPVFQWPSLTRPEAVATLQALGADLILVAAFGQYIPQGVVALPPKGCLNLHPSLLPRHRGASPVAAAILAGDAETGVTVLLVAAEMDAGDILAQARTPIGPDETTGSLTTRLATWGAEVFVETVRKWVQGQIVPRPQDHSQATWCERLTKEQGWLDWSKPAELLARQIRAYDPWPGTFTRWKGVQLNVLSATALPDWHGTETLGRVIRVDRELAVATGNGALRLDAVQLAGRKAVNAVDFANGARGFVGSVLG
jgi:methionyl-tRNA formyltransferase